MAILAPARREVRNPAKRLARSWSRNAGPCDAPPLRSRLASVACRGGSRYGDAWGACACGVPSGFRLPWVAVVGSNRWQPRVSESDGARKLAGPAERTLAPASSDADRITDILNGISGAWERAPKSRSSRRDAARRCLCPSCSGYPDQVAGDRQDVLAASIDAEKAADTPTVIDADELAKARLDERWREFCLNAEQYVLSSK